VLLLRNTDQEYNPLASFATCLSAGKGSDMSELRTWAKRFGGLTVSTLPWWASRSFIRLCRHA